MINIEVCPKCKTATQVAPGIGPFCPNEDCDVRDNLLQAEVAHLRPEVDYLRRRYDELLEERARLRNFLALIRDGGAYTTSRKWQDWTRSTLREVAQDAIEGRPLYEHALKSQGKID